MAADGRGWLFPVVVSSVVLLSLAGITGAWLHALEPPVNAEEVVAQHWHGDEEVRSGWANGQSMRDGGTNANIYGGATVGMIGRVRCHEDSTAYRLEEPDVMVLSLRLSEAVELTANSSPLRSEEMPCDGTWVPFQWYSAHLAAEGDVVESVTDDRCTDDRLDGALHWELETEARGGGGITEADTDRRLTWELEYVERVLVTCA